MSSRSPTRPDRPPAFKAAGAALAALAMLLTEAAPAAAAVPLPVAGVLSGGGETAVVVDLSAGDDTAHPSVRISMNGQAQPADLIPVMSDGLAVTIVVDASTAGAAALPAWLSAAARFILEAPGETQATVIPDRSPAAPAIDPVRGPSEVVGALTGMHAAGERDTAAALTLARGQFPRAGTGRRVVIMYTSATDAGGVAADDLADDFRASGTILVVVGTAAAADYWSAAAAATGGFFAPSGDPVVAPALDQVQSTLRDRYLVSFATPSALPATVTMQVDVGSLTMTGQALIPAPGAPGRNTALLVPIVAATVLAAGVAVAVLLIARSRRPRPEAGPPALTTVFVGRAVVPRPARGSASVPRDASLPRDHGTPWS
jgi:hypothetical protein